MLPHFLFHELEQTTLKGVIGKINTNARIKHETLQVRKELKEKIGKRQMGYDLVLELFSGITSDNMGICCSIADVNET